MVLGILGLFGGPLLVLIAVFVFLAASAEAGMVLVRPDPRHFALQAMVTDFQTVVALDALEMRHSS